MMPKQGHLAGITISTIIQMHYKSDIDESPSTRLVANGLYDVSSLINDLMLGNLQFSFLKCLLSVMLDIIYGMAKALSGPDSG